MRRGERNYEEQIKEAFEDFCEGDNNQESFLSAQYADWVTVVLDFSSAEYSDDNCYAFVDGIIPYLPVYDRDGKFVSAWGDGHEFDKKDIKHNDFYDEPFLENVKGRWTFEIKIEDNPYNDYPDITFEEFAATEI